MIDCPLGPLPILCDEAGIALPGQHGAKLEYSVGEMPTITVTFDVDGILVRCDKSPGQFELHQRF